MKNQIGANVQLVLLIFMTFLGARAQVDSPVTASVVAARATGVTSQQVFSFLNSESPLVALPDAQFIKLEMLFLKATNFDQIRIESFDKAFQDGIDFYLNFDDNFRFQEGGKDFVVFDNLKTPEVEAVAINFRRNSGLCLKNIEFKLHGQKLNLKAPILVDTKFDLSKHKNLFDSKLSSYVKIVSVEQKPIISLSFLKALNLDHIMIWPGNFMTDLIFKKYSRLKNFDFQCDHGTYQSLNLEDQLSPQLLKLSGEMKCQKINLRLNSIYPGSQFPELALTELRFLNNDQVYLPDISDFEKKDSLKVQSEFAASEFSDLLTRQLISSETKYTFILRLHADGSFFLHGVDELSKENTSFYILGDFVPVSLEKNRIKLKLHGIKRSSTIEMDSLSCGRKCFSANDFSNEKYFFEQDILIRRGKDRFYRIDTLAEKKSRRFDFTGVRFLIDHSL